MRINALLSALALAVTASSTAINRDLAGTPTLQDRNSPLAPLLEGRDTSTCQSEIACDTFSRRDFVTAPAPRSADELGLSNAERMARGLPLKKPEFRNAGDRAAKRADGSSVPPVPYRGVIQVFNGATSLGYVQVDPAYWTPLLVPDIDTAQLVTFQLPQGATSGTQINIQHTGRPGFPFFGLVVGRDSTSSDIASSSYNYLYFDEVATPGTAPGATPQSIDSYFSTSTGLDKQAETALWNVDVASGALSVQWINTDGSSPTTFAFVQSNHLYAGGDPAAFLARFPAPVTTVTLVFVPH